MAWIENLSGYLKKLVLIEKEIEDMSEDVKDLSKGLMDHEKRLIRIETMIEMSGRQSGPGKISD
ncbi:hypothetical protein N9W89_10105 [Hellea sp.]|nr:hypothetical protein [Hellea sp.]